MGLEKNKLTDTLRSKIKSVGLLHNFSFQVITIRNIDSFLFLFTIRDSKILDLTLILLWNNYCLNSKLKLSKLLYNVAIEKLKIH